MMGDRCAVVCCESYLGKDVAAMYPCSSGVKLAFLVITILMGFTMLGGGYAFTAPECRAPDGASGGSGESLCDVSDGEQRRRLFAGEVRLACFADELEYVAFLSA